MSDTKKTVLVTGGRGFIGRHLVAELLERGFAVRTLNRPGKEDAPPGGVEERCGDVRDMDACSQAVEGCDVVYHLAAKTAGSAVSPGETRSTNLDGTRQLARAAARAGVSRFVFCSTCGIYGAGFRGPAREESPKRPNTPYRVSKWMAEQWLDRLHRDVDMEIVVGRPASVVGPGGTTWAGLVRAIARGGFRRIGPGTHRLHACPVEDAAHGLLLCGTVPGIDGEAFNIVDDQPLAFRELVEVIASFFGSEPGRPSPRLPFAAYNGLSNRLFRLTGHHLPRAKTYEMLLWERTFDISKARHRLGYDPQRDPREALRRMAAWVQETGSL